jgi:hypothetical protein
MGLANTYRFARLFLAPGAQHCASAVGPAPGTPYAYPAVAMPLPDLVNWVERGQAPLSIQAVKIDPQTNYITESRILCAYPLTAVYDGYGNPNVSTNYRCSRGYADQYGGSPFAGDRAHLRDARALRRRTRH